MSSSRRHHLAIRSCFPTPSLSSGTVNCNDASRPHTRTPPQLHQCCKASQISDTSVVRLPSRSSSSLSQGKTWIRSSLCCNWSRNLCSGQPHTPSDPHPFRCPGPPSHFRFVFCASSRRLVAQEETSNRHQCWSDYLSKERKNQREPRLFPPAHSKGSFDCGRHAFEKWHETSFRPSELYFKKNPHKRNEATPSFRRRHTNVQTVTKSKDKDKPAHLKRACRSRSFFLYFLSPQPSP